MQKRSDLVKNSQKWNEIPESTRAMMISELTSELSILRAKAKITQEELAGAIGISRQMYSQIECGKTTMSWSIYLSLLFFYSTNESTSKLLEALNIYPNDHLCKEVE